MKTLLRKRLLSSGFPLLLFVLITLVQFVDIPAVYHIRERLDGLLYDFKVKYLPTWPSSVTNVQIVDIDESSLAEVGRMPWSRAHFAALTHKLSELGALVIAYDVLFTEPEPNTAESVIQKLDGVQLSSELKDALLNQFDFDQMFAHSISQSEVVLATLFHRDKDARSGEFIKTGILRADGVTQSPKLGENYLPLFNSYAGVNERFVDKASGAGFMNAFEDQDGFVRRANLLVQNQDNLYPSLALETFRVYSLLDKLEPKWQQVNDKRFLSAIQIGSSEIATDIDSSIYVPFRGLAKTYPYTSAADVLADKIEDQRFDQAVVFVGTSATGLADLRSTPVSLSFPGVEIHATVFDALQHPEVIPHMPDWWPAVVFMLMLFTLLLSIWLFPGQGPLISSLLSVALTLFVILLNWYVWSSQVMHLPLLCSLLLVMSLSAHYIASGFFAESRRRVQVKAIFDQYVPPAHIEKLLDDPQSASLKGERKELSVMFCDIRGFTSISESMRAEDLKLWLNQFFSPITRSILQHEGTIDKYVGDMVMAFWGAPVDEPEHANKSIAAAFAMLDALETLNQAFADQNKPKANIGIGINTGEMNVGDMGSDFRRSYTVIGDAVNLGSRLEGLTKFYGVEILVSEFTQKQANGFEFLLVDKVRVKGKDVPVTIFTPLPAFLSQLQKSACEGYTQALSCYFNKEFARAGELLNQLGDFSNQRLVTLYQQRVSHFLLEPPSGDWDGCFTHTSK